MGNRITEPFTANYTDPQCENMQEFRRENIGHFHFGANINNWIAGGHPTGGTAYWIVLQQLQLLQIANSEREQTRGASELHL